MLKSKIGIFSLVLMTISAVDNIRNLPSIAIFGKQILFFYFIASLFFFIPCALVSAQLSSASNRKNGIYHWVKNAFGPRLGLIAVWLQWTENIVWYPTLLTFIVGTVGYYISPELPNHPGYLITAAIACFYIISGLNIYGFKLSANFINFCAIIGLLLPMSFIIFLGLNWYLSGSPISTNLIETSFIPDIFNSKTWTALTTIVMSLCGVEITTAHVKKIKHPQKNYPKSLLFSIVIILLTLILASLSISAVVPTRELSFVSGIVQAIEVFLRKNELLNYLKYFVIAAVIGSLGSLNNWLISPIQGLKEAAKDGLLPHFFDKTNKRGVPINLLFIQMLIITVLIYLFTYFPTINSAYWFMTVIASQLYMSMYIFMFLAYLKLRNESNYRFKIPGDKVRIIIPSLGIIGCFATILVGFIPFENNCNPILYAFEIVSILIVATVAPLAFSLSKKTRIMHISQSNYLTALSKK